MNPQNHLQISCRLAEDDYPVWVKEIAHRIAVRAENEFNRAFYDAQESEVARVVANVDEELGWIMESAVNDEFEMYLSEEESKAFLDYLGHDPEDDDTAFTVLQNLGYEIDCEQFSYLEPDNLDNAALGTLGRFLKEIEDEREEPAIAYIIEQLRDPGSTSSLWYDVYDLIFRYEEPEYGYAYEVSNRVLECLERLADI